MMNDEPRRAGTGAEFQFGWHFDRAANIGNGMYSSRSSRLRGKSLSLFFSAISACSAVQLSFSC
jgi:hypothetical protein